MGMAKGMGKCPAERKGQAPQCWWEQGDTSQVQPHTHGDQSTSAPTALHLLCHHTDFDPEDTGLLFGRGPLQAHVPACELHGEFHLDLWETGGESWLASRQEGAAFPERGCESPGPTYPVHLNHIHVPVFCLHGLWVQLWGEMVCEFCWDTAWCQPCCHPNLVAPKAPDLQMV